MLTKSPAIVLGSVKYGDSSIILKTYTREEGVKSFIAGGLQTKKGPLRPALVQPLSQLNLVYYVRSKGELRRLKEASVGQAYENLFYDPVKISLAMFLAEVLSHLLQEEEPDFKLYDFLASSMLTLDQMQAGVGNFHLVFLIQLTAYLGFKPEEPKGDVRYFDLLNGVYSKHEPPHYHYLDTAMTSNWQTLQQLTLEKASDAGLNRLLRESLLTALLDYYRLHIKDFGRLKSLDILKAILS